MATQFAMPTGSAAERWLVLLTNSEAVQQHSPGSRSAPRVPCTLETLQTLKGFHNFTICGTPLGFTASTFFLTQGALRDPGLCC